MSPTVRVKSSHPDHEQGFYVINESDFDEAVHELWKPVSETHVGDGQGLELKDEAAAKRADAQKAAYAARQREPNR